MLPCFTADAEAARPLHLIAAAEYAAWRDHQPPHLRRWLDGLGFEAKAGAFALLPGEDGAPVAAVLVIGEPASPFDVAVAPARLPAGAWRIGAPAALDPALAALGFALASYRFGRYRKPAAGDQRPRLVLGEDPPARRAATIAEAVHLARDLINTPAADLGPAELAGAVAEVAGAHGAELRVVEGDAVAEGYPAIHAVGRASARPPHVIDLSWGDPGAPRLTLVGKGVCFDTGGLDLKSASNMLLMKKDMGGAAVTLGLAQAIMALRLPVRLRLMIGAVENAVSGASFRPGDVLRTRKGITVEIGNTDAEGRLVLADLLAEADAEGPALMIDCATLTGAARIAVGPDLPALFTPDDRLADELLAAGEAAFEPLWRLPLHAPYRELLDSRVADLANSASGGFAGAITAALFLKEFVDQTTAWAHLDIFGWNPSDQPGRPKGGEASALRALLGLIERRFGAGPRDPAA